MIEQEIPRGIRNRNPGNIEYKNAPWRGLDEPPTDGRFCRFEKPVFGIRAIYRTLMTYYDKRKAEDGSKIDTAQEIIERWAPKNENRTDVYVKFVRKQANLRPGQIVDLHHGPTLKAIAKAMIHMENGCQPYTEAQFNKALVLAGVDAGPKQLKQSRTMAGAQVAGGATVLGMVTEHLDEIQGIGATFAPIVGRIIDVAPWILGAAAVLGIGWIMWARWTDHRDGLR